MREVILSTEAWQSKAPFKITGYTFTQVPVLHVKILQNGATGRGEAAGIYYLNETADSMLAQAETVKAAVQQGASREQLRELLPAGGARNAIDCALWDLEAKLSGKRVWELAGVELGDITTVNTIGMDTPENMAETAKSLDTPIIKIKLDGEQSLERVTAIRNARPNAQLVVDVNQGWTFEQLVDLAPKLKDLGVAMIEQPLPRGGDEALEGYHSPIPLCADESCLNTSEFEQASRRYQMINIKLDKTGGLTEGLDLARMAREKGLGVMVGNMMGTSLAMAPGFVVAQLCRFVDLDGPLFLKQDRENPMTYTGGRVSAPNPALWG